MNGYNDQQPPSRRFRALTLPHLTSLRLTIPEYDVCDGEDAVSLLGFSSFLERSECNISVLGLVGLQIDDGKTIYLVELLPLVMDLTVQKHPKRRGRKYSTISSSSSPAQDSPFRIRLPKSFPPSSLTKAKFSVPLSVRRGHSPLHATISLRS
ncbi:hypothetical protein D9758_005032 [Tetrapyrgos nigripes]|uniref:Uncharacterized protein n=1 Tax=Tetrapyrgos nigripes TaxID=182062 RepID=A0A8H5LWH1_9AGAR|nr:hypothetical protein D9758_005032 [Tetrapyrgos nigripes]